MKKSLKASLSVLLSLIMILSAVSVSFAAGHPLKESTRTTVPTVYVKGFGHPIYKDKNDPSSECIYSNRQEVKPETYQKLFDGFAEPLKYAIKTDEWSVYSDFIVNTVIGDLSRFRLDDNGDPSDGSGNDFNHDKNPVDRKGSDGKYDLYTYYFVYDQRLDPFTNAAELHQYIEDVKAVTGYEKVNLLGRCFGTTIVLAYLAEYGFDNINALELYIGMYKGLDAAGALFSGRAETDPKALQLFCEKNFPDSDDMTFLKAMIGMMNAVNTLNLPIELVYKVYNRIYEDVIPRLLLESFATMPGYWTLIGPDYYDAAKALLFGGNEAKYARLIERIDRYHNEVMLNAENILKEGMAQGVNIYNFTKYGGVQAPLCKEALQQSDGCTSIVRQCFGTSCADMFSPYNEKYMQAAKKNGTIKYISPDRLLDASADILRDHTWFAKGVGHDNMPYEIDLLMANVFEENGYGSKTQYITTDYFDSYPQFLIAESDTYGTKLRPLTAENKADGDGWHKTVPENFLTILKKLFGWITELMRIINTIVEEIKK